LPKSVLAKACNYTLALWSRLTRFLEHPELELSNNLAENSMRPVALGRRYEQSEIRRSLKRAKGEFRRWAFLLINPGPYRKISHSSIWNVAEEELHKRAKASDYRQVGDCEMFFYNACLMIVERSRLGSWLCGAFVPRARPEPLSSVFFPH
jgi:hypothetical protein